MDRLLLSCVVLFVMLAVAPAAPAMLVDPVAVSARSCSIDGTGRNDRLAGTGADDRLCGLGGADKIRGGRGADVLLGGAGGDLLQGREGRDRLEGGAGNDRVFGGAGADDLRGGAGRDALGGGLGPDELSGGAGRDIAYFGQRTLPVRVTIGAGANDGVVGERDDVNADVEDIQSGARNDVLRGNGAANQLIGGGGRDQLYGGRGSDVLIGGDGNDRLDAREGATARAGAAQAGSVDRVVCGGGIDTAFVDPVDLVDPDCETVVGASGSNPPAQNPPGQNPPGQNPPASNQAPTAVDDSATVAEDSGAGAIDVLANDSDPDGGAKTISSASDPANGTVAVTNGGTGLTYEPDADYCGSDSFTYTLNGGSTATVSVTVTCVEDAPTAVDDSATAAEDSAAGAIDVLANDTDPDGGTMTISSASDPANGTVAVTGGGTGLTYEPDANFCGSDSFTYTLNGGSTATVSMTVTCVNDPPVADDETFDGANGAVGNTSLVVNTAGDGAPALSSPKKTVSGDILTGDSDIDGPGPLTVTEGTFATNDGGQVTIEADGDFIYHPGASTSCTDTSDFFDYTLEDSGSPELTDTGRVTIAIAGCVWYVSNNAAGNSGTASAPFDTLTQAETASAANHTVFVFDGDNTATGYDGNGYTMNSGERLLGEHEGLTVDPDQGGPLAAQALHPANPGAHPTLTATNADVIDLDDANEVRGFNLDPSGTGGGIAGATGDVSGTIDDVNINDTTTAGTQPGLELDATTGSFPVSNFTVSTNGATGVRLNNAGTVTFAPTGTISITTANARGLDATGTNLGTSTFDSITVTGSGSGGVSLSGTSGTTSFAGLSLATTSGTAPAFSLSSAGTVSVPPTATANISAVGGPAVQATGTSGAQLEFDVVSSTSSSSDGIDLAGLGNGTFSAAGGTITGAAGIGFDLDGGNGNISYPGAMNNGSGQTAEITGRSGGAVALSGAIADTIDAGGGISLSGNTGGSTTFSAASKVLNTTTAAAVSFTGSDNHTLTLSGGGLDIDTTSGQGIVATTSGTLVVSGTANTIDSFSATALNVTNTDIGGAGLTFQRISSGNNTADADPANGIVLNNTGTSAGLTILGTGSANSGGSIQNVTGHGVSLTSTSSFNADELSITGANQAGVDGTDVTNFTYTDGEVIGAGDSLTNEAHAAFAFNDVGANNIDGQLTVTGNTVTNPYGGGVMVRNASGTLSQATVSSNAIQSTTSTVTSKQDGVSFHIEGTTTTAAGLTDATIGSNSIVNFPSGNGVELVGEQITSTSAPRASFGVPDTTTNRIEVTNNEIRGDATNKMGVFGVAASVTGMADGNVRIANNGTAAVPMQNILGEGIGVGASGTANADFIVEDNFVSPGNMPGNVGIRANANRRNVGGTIVSTPDVTATIQDNVVSNTSGSGINVLHFNSNGSLRTRIINNTVGASIQPNPAVAVENGSTVDADTPNMCAQVSGNTTTASPPDGSGNTFPGVDLIERDGALQIHGLIPTPATAGQTESYVGNQNPASNLGGGLYAGIRASVSEGTQFEQCTVTF